MAAATTMSRKRSFFDKEFPSAFPLPKRRCYFPPPRLPIEEAELQPPINTNNKADWAEFLLKELMGCGNIEDAKSRAYGVLESYERSITAASVVVNSNSCDQETINKVVQENGILKRAVAIQHQRKKKKQEDHNAQVKELMELVEKLREEVTSLNVNNHALTLYLHGAQQGKSMADHCRWRPDVF